ncbi:hypothetical protein BO70DRAFT_425392 [Aspergillus heteromorphus CBS 117.55]|uniref:PWI domain-containing protein n=1 Tax=Aspergillus heteromorphus CBS 117.55 TaxID=1448321 RepID=A0A317X535_9EURO|nr:uncharacterized protein BO70DRAFT_425392 [Aspergillus heteromorphus CBS 117.55]PWY92722.1 hypothetical protein BO70DRAFT_425392 [Aspergillus heteromorphus CBS 117.55]
MATSVDAKMLRQTKFPPEFSRKVDMNKVNIEVMKKWIASKISEILGNEDDVVIELCFNLLEGSRFPDVKSLQIQLTGFLDKDTARFCKELWSLCLSAQENPQGVPKELLEAKKLELIQEKIEAEKAAEEARKQKEQERVRERELEDIRRRERSDRPRGGRRGGRGGGRDFERHGSSIPMSPPVLVEAVDPPHRPVALVLAPRPLLARPRLVDHAIPPTTAPDDLARRAAPSPRTAETAGGPADAVLITKRPTETAIRFVPQCIAVARLQGPAQKKRFLWIKVPFPVSSRARKSRDDRRLSRSRDRDDHRRRRYSSRSVSRSRSRSRSRNRSASQDSRSRSRSNARDRKRRRSLPRYAPAARRRRNTSSVSVRSDKRQRMADENEEAPRRASPRPEKASSSDQEMKDATETTTSNPARARISSSELRERLLREKIVAMRRTASSDKVGSTLTPPSNEERLIEPDDHDHPMSHPHAVQRFNIKKK